MKMFKNPQLVHVAIEIAIFLAFVFWATSSNRRLNFHIKSLHEKVSEMENEILQLKALLISARKSSPARQRPQSPPAPSSSPRSLPVKSNEPSTPPPPPPAPETELEEEHIYTEGAQLDFLEEQIQVQALPSDEDLEFERDLREELSRLPAFESNVNEKNETEEITQL